MPSKSKTAVIGLGYVGLPLAVALAENHNVVGYDIAAERIDQLRDGYDCTGEISSDQLGAANIEYCSEPAVTKGAKFFIVTVPTPVDKENKPDLTAILAASKTVGGQIKPGAIVIYESTVWPGLTEEICARARARFGPQKW